MTFNIDPIDAKETPKLIFGCSKEKKTGGDFRSLNADFRSQMHVAGVLKHAFQSQKNASELKHYLFQMPGCPGLSLHPQAHSSLPPFATSSPAFGGWGGV